MPFIRLVTEWQRDDVDNQRNIAEHVQACTRDLNLVISASTWKMRQNAVLLEIRIMSFENKKWELLRHTFLLNAEEDVELRHICH